MSNMCPVKPYQTGSENGKNKTEIRAEKASNGPCGPLFALAHFGSFDPLAAFFIPIIYFSTYLDKITKKRLSFTHFLPF